MDFPTSFVPNYSSFDNMSLVPFLFFVAFLRQECCGCHVGLLSSDMWCCSLTDIQPDIMFPEKGDRLCFTLILHPTGSPAALVILVLLSIRFPWLLGSLGLLWCKSLPQVSCPPLHTVCKHNMRTSRLHVDPQTCFCLLC